MSTVAHSVANDSSFAVQWTALGKEMDSLENKVKLNLSSAVNSSSEISSDVQANHRVISDAITQVIDLVNSGYRLMNTTALERLDVYLGMLGNIARELGRLMNKSSNK